MWTDGGWKWPKDAPRGDYPELCDICGIRWRRSRMDRNRAGQLCCPDCIKGRDDVALDEENRALTPRARPPVRWP